MNSGTDRNCFGHRFQYVLFFVLISITGHNFSQTILEGQVAHFPFNTDLTDASPSNIAATNTGGVYIDDRFGLANNAIDLSGNNYVHFNDANVKVDLPLTISAWVYVYSFSQLNIVFKSDNIYDNYHGYWLNVIASNGRVGINFSGGTGGANASNRRTFLTNTSLPLQQWVLVTAIIRTGQDMDIYFNCDLQPGTYSGTGSMSIAYSTTNSRIGSSVGDNALQSDRFFNGVIDDFIIWDRELTVAEITYYCSMHQVETFIPNVFSPNADESNDFFSVSGFEHHKDFQIVILNRWGNAMFTSTDPNFTWNGQDQSGLEATEGVYFYLITGLSPYDGKPKEFHGFIHLVR
jgi:gliding motility-associated-like protein